MELILWRHAEAEEGDDDLARALTKRGQQQANRMAGWLRHRLPKEYKLLVSEAVRSQQTAAFLSQDFHVSQLINPSASTNDILKALNWPHEEGTIVLVGHQPYLGCVAATLMAKKSLWWSVKKGAIWWIDYREKHGIEQVRLKAMLTPGMLEGIE